VYFAAIVGKVAGGIKGSYRTNPRFTFKEIIPEFLPPDAD